MDYIFGHERRGGADVETVKTVGSTHTGLSGRMAVTRHYADSDITDTFRVLEKFRTAEGADGRCYDWYLIDSHYRYEDRFTPGIGKTEQEITELEIGSMEQAQALTDAEIAILELQEG